MVQVSHERLDVVPLKDYTMLFATEILAIWYVYRVFLHKKTFKLWDKIYIRNQCKNHVESIEIYRWWKTLFGDPLIRSKFHKKWSFVFSGVTLWVWRSCFHWSRTYILFYDSSIFFWRKSQNVSNIKKWHIIESYFFYRIFWLKWWINK